jgi:hypothetical protein
MIGQEVVEPYKNTTIGIQEEISDSFNELIREQIEPQYIELENLGIDYIEANIINDDIYIDFINYIDETYISIINVQNIFDNPVQLQIVGKSLYEIFCVDMVNDIIPRVLKFYNLQDSYELGLLNKVSIKEALFNIGEKRLINLKKLYTINNSNKIRYEIIKMGLFLDIINTDIELLLENFIFPISEKYASVFYSKTP